MYNILEEFISHFGYLQSVGIGHENKLSNTNDSVLNYCCNVCHWVLLLLNFQYVVNEGDVIRVIPTLMYCLLFLFLHSRLSKYFEDCLDVMLKCEYMLSPMDRMRELEGALANLRGGMGSNIESDLVQKNYVRNQKDLTRSLGANTT